MKQIHARDWLRALAGIQKNKLFKRYCCSLVSWIFEARGQHWPEAKAALNFTESILSRKKTILNFEDSKAIRKYSCPDS